MVFHDVCDALRGVKIAVRRFLRKHPEFQVIAREDTLVVVKKLTEPRKPLVSTWDRLQARILSPLLQIELSIRKRLKRLRK